MLFNLPCSLSKFKSYAVNYKYRTKAEFDDLNQRLNGKRELTIDDLQALIAWKSPRTKSKVAANSAAEVLSVSRLALAMPKPYLAVHTLTALSGVGISVASTIMAFVDPEIHAVMDRHSVRALGEKNLYLATWTARYYEEYRLFLLEHKHDLSLRELEQGLFMYSREEMGKLS